MRLSFLLWLSLLLLGLGLLAGYLSSRPASPAAVADKIASSLADELNALDRQAQRWMNTKNLEDTLFSIDGRFSFFLYDQKGIVSWSGNLVVPPARALNDTLSIKLVKSSGADYIIKRWKLSQGKHFAGLIPLYRQYPIRNDYLQPEWNHNVFPPGNISILEPNATLGTPVCVSGQCIFRISFLPESSNIHEKTTWAAVFLISCSIVLFLLASLRAVMRYGKHHPDSAFLCLLAILWVLRWVMTTLNFPGIFTHAALFDPQHFASSNLNRSLGDLVLNLLALFALCYYLFRNYYRFRILRTLYSKPLLRIALSIAGSFLFFISFLFPLLVLQTIYNNSPIVLDIAQSLRFDTVRVTAQLAVLISWVCSFLFAHVTLRLLIERRSHWRVSLYFAAGGLLFIILNELTGQRYAPALLIGTAYFLAVYLFGFYKQLQKVNYATFTYLFTAIVALALISTITVQNFTRKEKIENQFRFANNFLVDRDIFGEHLLQEVSRKIARDGFIQARLSSPFLGKDAVRQKVRQVFLPSYFNKYDVEILLFGAGGSPIANRSETTFAELMNIYSAEAFQTDYEGVYFVSNPSSDITQRYLIVTPIVKSNITSGYVVVELLLKKIIPESVYPELLIDNRFQQFYHTADLSYAVYGRTLLYSSGSFNYERLFKREYLGDPDIHLNGVVHAGYVHVAMEDGNNRVAVISSPVTPPTYILANFAFLLVLGLSLLLIFILIQGLGTLIAGRTLFFSARIQLVLNLAFFVPLFIVSATTLSLTSIASQEQLSAEYLSKSKSFGAQVETMVDEYTESDDVTRVELESQLTDLAKLFNLDANVYSAEGHLLASSQPLIIESGLVAPLANPEAVNRIMNGEDQMIVTEQVGNLKYFVSFASLKSPQTGKVDGILALPFFQSQSSLEKIQLRILANILNVFAVIFIALIILSYAVSEWLTFPLRFITRSLSKTTLTRINQPLRWRANDEIGLMVKEYNQMLYKLAESKAELEQSQRERAWREIAQQVAHEIKNPLTPMKLTLQQLERHLQSGSEGEIRERIKKALLTLLTQVDSLNDIASSFSTFARMPAPEIQRLELGSLIRRTVDLHSQSGQISLRHPSGEIYVLGDPQLLSRIFSNLILNAFQATRPGIPPRVEISLERENGFYRIQFKDNGNGIDAKLADRVFVPHFSTKRSGSGLGLAISKQGIEQMGGSISFESNPGVGTTFVIDLPVS